MKTGTDFHSIQRAQFASAAMAVMIAQGATPDDAPHVAKAAVIFADTLQATLAANPIPQESDDKA